MFEHSVKVPRHYKIAATIFKKVSTEGGSLKTLLYDNKLRHFRTNVLYALITETIKHASDIENIFESCRILENESRLDPWLAKVLTSELLFGKKSLPGKSKPEQTILSYKEKFEKYASEHQDELKSEVTPRPRYIRINTNLLTTSDAIRAFQDEGYRFIRCTSGSYEDYLKQIQNLTEYDFTQDYHIKTIFVFAPGTKLHEHELYLENKIILQDKATAMPVHLLAPPAGSVVLDMCAAPGMKTTQLAAYMRNSGKIYAVERNEKRYQTLCDFVANTGSTCVETIHKDTLEIKKGDIDDVEYILLDPSCSGSGMDLCVHNYIETTRLVKLTSLQEKFLKHAMNAFPKAKRIVYSTCSLYPEENERVITNVVKTSRCKWRVQDVKELLKGQWNNFGSAMYGSMGTRCMYAKSDSDHTIGFFLAVLDRDQKDMDKCLRNEEDPVKTKDAKKQKMQNKKVDDPNKELSNEIISENCVDNKVNNENSKSKKKKHKMDTYNLKTTDLIDTDNDTEVPKKKKKMKHNESDQCSVNTGITDENVQLQDNTTAKKKKNKKKRVKSDTTIESITKCSEEAGNLEELGLYKKKRKREVKIADNSNETMPVMENQNTIPFKKNKSKDYTQESIDNAEEFKDGSLVSGKDELPIRNKKKKHKDVL